MVEKLTCRFLYVTVPTLPFTSLLVPTFKTTNSVGQPTFSFETHVPRALPSWARGEGAIRHRFDHLDECCAFLKNEGIPIYGVEIVEGATSIEELPFTGGVAIMLGNEVRHNNLSSQGEMRMITADPLLVWGLV